MTGTIGFLASFSVTAFNPLNGGGSLGFSKALRSFQLVAVVIVCSVDFLRVLLLRVFYLQWCPIIMTVVIESDHVQEVAVTESEVSTTWPKQSSNESHLSGGMCISMPLGFSWP